jgi:NADPH:quinone reductase-like Zn-dependent oxidoreductase
MRALVHDPDAPGGIRLGTAPDPTPRESQALIEVCAASVNFVDVAFAREQARPGEVPGMDAAGVVVAAAADGSGPPIGARVVTFGWDRGAWAQRRAVDTVELAVVPESVDLGAASALPGAGVTALRALRQLGPLLGRRVLITGASGGVGRYAVQLAARAGAYVIASVGTPARGTGLRELGADEVVTDLAQITEPVHGVLDNVGGELLARAYGLLAAGGCAQSVGMASLAPTTIDFERERQRGGRRRLEVFTVGNPEFGPGFGTDLAYLVDLVARRRLDPQVGWRGSWRRVAEAADALLGRRVPGKAVLEID